MVDRVYVDASVFVAALVGEDEKHHRVAVDFISHVQGGGLRAVVSGLVLAETLGSGPVRSGQGVPEAKRMERVELVQRFFDGAGFEYVELGAAAGRRAARLAVIHHLKGADACHLSMALLSGCQQLITLDDGLLKVENQEPPLTVTTPWSPYAQEGTLFGPAQEP
jgi:predicted nucleic acid-binding protein